MMCCSLLPRPFRIYYVGEKALASTVLLTAQLRYDFPQNVREALYMLHLLGGGTPEALHSLVHPEEVERKPSWTP